MKSILLKSMILKIVLKNEGGEQRENEVLILRIK